MRLTKFTDNALRGLIYLALNKDRIVTITEIAEKCAIPRNHLVKVIHALANRGFIETTRGRGGGARLMEPAKEIYVGDVVRTMEGQLDVINCYEPRCPIATTCRLRKALGEASDAFLRVLDSYTIADLIKENSSLKALLSIE